MTRASKYNDVCRRLLVSLVLNPRTFFAKNRGLLILNSLKQKKLIFNFFVNRNWKKLTDSRKRVKTLGDNRTRKSHQPIETLN